VLLLRKFAENRIFAVFLRVISHDLITTIKNYNISNLVISEEKNTALTPFLLHCQL
jgi:hypothetical protein